MAIHIIGSSTEAEPEENPLPKVDVDLPHPNSAAANHRPLDADQIVALLKHDNPIVRTYALEQVSSRKDDKLAAAAIASIDDEDPLVAIEAIGIVESLEQQNAVEPLKKRFAEATGDLAATIASALGHLAPDVLLECVKQRGRMDGEAYAATATALAIIGSDEVVDFLGKALNRAGALSPDRKGALYGAALLSGNEALAGRVIGLAIEDSKQEEPKNASFPTRAALSVLTGVPIPYSRRDEGLALLDLARDTLEAEVLPLLEGDGPEKLGQALKLKRPADIIASLAQVLELEPIDASEDPSLDKELGSMPRRRRGLLAALVHRADAIGALELQAAGLFVAAATKAASVVLAGGGDESKSPGIAALSKALEGSHDASALATLSVEELTKLFAAKSPREMRRILTIVTRETFLRNSTIERFLTAAIHGGHGEALIDTSAESEDPTVHAAVIRSFAGGGEAAEEAVVAVLERDPLEERPTPLALACAEEVRTERIGLVTARRFLELRAFGRSSVARVLLRVGDPRLLPVLASRAFADEPEEVAWSVLALVCGEPNEGKLAEALGRTMSGRDATPRAPEVRLPLACDRCKEALWYGFERVFLDIEAKDELGDPAFVGEVVCKACGAKDRLVPTPEGGQVLTQHMMQFLQAAQTGQMDSPPLVTPAQTEVNGKKVGLATALRMLSQDIEVSPTAIRPRLHRARLRLLLRRDGVGEDLDAVLEAHPTAVEAMAMRATQLMREGNRKDAMTSASQALIQIRADGESVRLYDTESREGLIQNLEEYVVELEALGLDVPEGLELTAARRRRDERLREAEFEMQARRSAANRPAPPPAAEEAPAPSFKDVGRNDACPCGSGKKFKRCHGAR